MGTRIHKATVAKTNVATAAAPANAELLAAFSCAVAILDANGELVAANPEGERVLAWASRELGAGWEACIEQRRAAKWLLAGPQSGEHLRLRLNPYTDAGQSRFLLEGQDASSEVADRCQMEGMRKEGNKLQAAHEELMCAYEVIETNQEVARVEYETQTTANEMLMHSNQSLTASNRRMSARIQEMEDATANRPPRSKE